MRYTGHKRTLVRVSVEDLAEDFSGALPKAETTEEDAAPELDLPALVRLLLDVVPNPWQGARIVSETLAELRRRGISEERICTNRLFLAKAMREDLRRQVHQATEAEFRRMLSDGQLSFRLEASGDPRLNWELAELQLSVQRQVMRFQLLLEDDWRSQVAEGLKGPANRESAP